MELFNKSGTQEDEVVWRRVALTLPEGIYKLAIVGKRLSLSFTNIFYKAGMLVDDIMIAPCSTFGMH